MRVVLLTVACLAIAATAALLASGRRRAVDIRRWRGRAWSSYGVQALVYGIPLAAAVGVSALLSGQLGPPVGAGGQLRTWSLLLVSSGTTMFLVERLSRRLLPLAALLKLSLVFPDRAPKRLAVARRAGSTKKLQARLKAARDLGIDTEPVKAAATILELVGSLHAHDRRTRGHSERVRTFTDLLADELRLDADDRDRLRWAALLHDIGKLHVPARILNKPARPDPHEWEAIHRHPAEGARLAAPLAPWLGPWADTILEHHERWDGTGYPNGLAGAEINYGARIVAVADSYEVMTSARTYKKPISAQAAREELTRHAGTQFDPAIVRAFVGISLGRLRWSVGPLSWLAQVPFLGWLPHVAGGVAAAGGQAAGVLGAAAAGATILASGGGSASFPAIGVPAIVPAVSATPTTATTAASGSSQISVPGPTGSATAPAGTATTTTTVKGSSSSHSSSHAASTTTGPTSAQGSGTTSNPHLLKRDYPTAGAP